MFDIAPTELLLVGIVALLVIGPKDLPKAMRLVGYWVGKARGVARQFRAGFDSMVREAELADLEKQWASENERIMREHPPEPPLEVSASPVGEDSPAPPEQRIRQPEVDGPGGATAIAHPEAPQLSDDTPEPVMVERPAVVPASDAATAVAPDKAQS